MPAMPVERRSARAVIDQAISENKVGERLIYCLATAVCSAGLFAVIWGTLHSQGTVALAGSLPTAMLWPALNFASNVRKQNVALRLLEIPIERAATATASAEMLKHAFSVVFHGERLEWVSPDTTYRAKVVRADSND